MPEVSVLHASWGEELVEVVASSPTASLTREEVVDALDIILDVLHDPTGTLDYSSLAQQSQGSSVPPALGASPASRPRTWSVVVGDERAPQALRAVALELLAGYSLDAARVATGLASREVFLRVVDLYRAAAADPGVELAERAQALVRGLRARRTKKVEDTGPERALLRSVLEALACEMEEGAHVSHKRIYQLFEESKKAQLEVDVDLLERLIESTAATGSLLPMWELGVECVKRSERAAHASLAQLLHEVMTARLERETQVALTGVPNRARKFFAQMGLREASDVWAKVAENDDTDWQEAEFFQDISAEVMEKARQWVRACKSHANALAYLALDGRAKGELELRTDEQELSLNDLFMTVSVDKGGNSSGRSTDESLARRRRVDMVDQWALVVQGMVVLDCETVWPLAYCGGWFMRCGVPDHLANRVEQACRLYQAGAVDTAVTLLGPTSEGVVKWLAKTLGHPVSATGTNGPSSSKANLLDNLLDKLEQSSDREVVETARWTRFVIASEVVSVGDQKYLSGMNLRNRVCHDLDQGGFTPDDFVALFVVLCRLAARGAEALRRTEA